ncbi:MAG: ABC transporter ATP-binding protein [Alphaproteobacteria bacterium]|nr:ABC transporter ATP-binding protein [Alphaproteobacteria bacterium]
MSTASSALDSPTAPLPGSRPAEVIAAERTLGGDLRVLARICRLILRYRGRVALAVVATVVAGLFQLAIPPLLGRAVNTALGLAGDASVSGAAAREGLFVAAALLLAASTLRGAFTLVQNYGGESIGHLLAYDLRLAFYRKLQQLSFSFHDRAHTGDLITRGILDIDGVRWLTSAGLLRVLLLAILIGAGAIQMISTDITLGLLSLSFVPFAIWKSTTTRLRLRALWLTVQEKMAILGRIMDENLSGIRVVRAFGAEPHELTKYDRAADEAMAITHERVRTRAGYSSVMTLSYFVALGLVLWVGGTRVLAGAMSVGTLTEFLTFMTILQLPVRQMGMVVNAFARAATCGARLFVVLDHQPTIAERPDAKTLENPRGVVRFDDVSFAYPGGGDSRTLHRVSFLVEPGRTLGLVGPPGSGKSTIAHLLPRYYDVTAGRITIDGEDIRDLTLDSLRRAVRVVQQDSFLFTSSLENNIAYGDPWADEDAIHRAAATSQIEGFVERLPERYQTLVGERGVSLSGGQKQRVAIARAALLEPPVLILDDSTAAIDAGTEWRIREALRAGAANRATIIISHRLSTLRHADEILFIEGGQIVERGTHEQLIALNGRYAALHALQGRHDLTEAQP